MAPGRTRRLPCEPLRRTAGTAALHLDDPAVAERKHAVALLPASPLVQQDCRADDLVGAGPDEVGTRLEPTARSLADPRRQGRTGFIRAPSGRCVLPPQTTLRNAAPLHVGSEQRDERLGVALVERLRRCTKPMEHPAAPEYMSAPAVARTVRNFVPWHS
jgi:hypothetical protein